jgi:hypothetical protein
MNLLVGDRDAWYPLHTRADRRLDEFAHPIFVRPALRHYDVSAPFDDWRTALDAAVERLANRLKQHNTVRLSAFRTLLDFGVARRVYRALRRVSRACVWIAWEVPFGDDFDCDWIVGLALIVCSLGVLFVIVRPW